jgi:hypothetical protein
MYVSLYLTLYFLIVFHTFLTLVVTYVTPTAGVGYREKTHLVKLNEVVGFRCFVHHDEKGTL